MKAIEQYFHVVLFITTVYAVKGSFNFELCGWNPSVRPFKWKLLSSTFMRYCSLCWARWFWVICLGMKPYCVTIYALFMTNESYWVVTNYAITLHYTFLGVKVIKNVHLVAREWLFQISHGVDHEPVRPRQLPKSTGCGKNFPGKSKLATGEQVCVLHWRKLFVELGAGMGQWRECLPPTNVSRVWFWPIWVGFVFWVFFSVYSGYPLSTKINSSKFQFNQNRGLTWKLAKVDARLSL